MSIIARASGPVLEFPIRENGEIVKLHNATVSIIIKRGTHRIVKETVVSDAGNGVCEFVQTPNDFPVTGGYQIQGIIHLSGKNLLSELSFITVGKQL